MDLGFLMVMVGVLKIMTRGNAHHFLKVWSQDIVHNKVILDCSHFNANKWKLLNYSDGLLHDHMDASHGHAT